MMQKKYLHLILLSISALGLWSFFTQSNPVYSDSKRIKIALREAGNQLLLANNDSTSLILPVTKKSNKAYTLSFQKDLSIQPQELVKHLRLSLDNANIIENYIVEVIECSSKEVAYSYEIRNDLEKDIIPCAGRFLPNNCYQIEVAFNDKTSTTRNIVFAISLLIILLIVVYLLTSKKKAKQEPQSKPSPPDFISIGLFKFYPDKNKLVAPSSEINLSKKECEILELFSLRPNEIIKREDITKQIWEDNGVFVGRSLDTYISKLRKKLKEDPTVRISNIHGIGYKIHIE